MAITGLPATAQEAPAGAGTTVVEVSGPGKDLVVIPEGVCEVTIDAYGAQGGEGWFETTGPGGLGGRSSRSCL